MIDEEHVSAGGPDDMLVLTDLQVLCAQAIASGSTTMRELAAILDIKPSTASALCIRTAAALGVGRKDEIARAYSQNVYRIRVVPASRRNNCVRQARADEGADDRQLTANEGFKWPDYGPHNLRMRAP